MSEPFPFADLALSHRLERTEGKANACLVDAKARLFPDTGVCRIQVGGTYAMFDGVSSPITQTFGLGLFEPVTPAQLDEIEGFFRERGAPVFHEVSPLADAATIAALNERGYQPVEFTSVMFRPIRPGSYPAPAGDITVRLSEAGEERLWSEISARGWEPPPELNEFMQTIGELTARAEGSFPFFAEAGGVPIATGGLIIHDSVALLAGASTVPEGRKRGAELALVERRLEFAAGRGCDLAMMGAAPGSGSQRNAERNGFRIAYSRLKWGLAQK